MSSNTTEPVTTAEPSYNYVIHYQFAHPKSDLRPENQRWGNSSMSINTDKPVESDEEKLEVARFIGQHNKFERVAITRIEATDYFVDDSSELLEGVIVND